MKNKEFINLRNAFLYAIIVVGIIVSRTDKPRQPTPLYERPLLHGEPSFYVDKKDLTPNTMPATIIRSTPLYDVALPSGEEVLLYRTELDTDGDLNTVEFYSLTAFNRYFAKGRGLWIPDKAYIIYDSDNQGDLNPGPDPKDPQRISNLNFLALRKTGAR